MINEIYRKYKQEYNDYVLLIKSGNFYLSLNRDAYLMHNTFGYTIKEIKNGYKVGFPIQSIEKIKDKFNLIQINFILIEDNKIIYSKSYDTNQYKSFVSKKNYDIIFKRIDKITECLKKNIDNDIESTLTEIEGILCMID